MKIAFMFPGQGSQYSGMGKDIYEKYEEARKVYEKASEILKIDVKKICFELSEEELAKTENAQLSIAITSLAILEVLKKYKIEADILTGLSLGEYVALIHGEYISLEEGLKALKYRSYYMGNFMPNEEFAMAAVIGLESRKIEEICENLRNENYFVVPANYNYSMQTVISGNKNAIEKAIFVLKEAGAKRVIPLNTSGPFHTEKLNKAKELFSEKLENINFQQGDKTVIKNLDGTPYSNKDNIRKILAKHIVSPVRFDKTIKYMEENNIDTFIEIGPGKTMIGFVKKELKDSNCYTTNNLEELETVLAMK